MSNEELCFTPAVELASLIASRALSPVELAEAVIERIEALEPNLNAFATFTPERALASARAAEQAVIGGGGSPERLLGFCQTANFSEITGSTAPG